MDIHKVCKGARDGLLCFDKKVIPGNWNSVKTERSTARVAEAAEADMGETGLRGRRHEGKPDPQYAELWKWGGKAQLNMWKKWRGSSGCLRAKGFVVVFDRAGGICGGWREQDGPQVGAVGTGQCLSQCRRLRHGCYWDLSPFSPLPGMWLQGKQPGWAPLPRTWCWVVAELAGVVTPNNNSLTLPGLRVTHTSGEQ